MLGGGGCDITLLLLTEAGSVKNTGKGGALLVVEKVHHTSMVDHTSRQIEVAVCHFTDWFDP